MGEYIVHISREEIEKVFEEKPRELVRCKDCRYWVPGKNECHNINSYMQYRPCFKDWFCADGEV